MARKYLLPEKGNVLIEGLDTSDETLLYDIRQKVGMVFQNPDNQLVATIVEEDVAFAPENLGIKQEEIRSRVDYALDAVGMSSYKQHAPHMLSGGQKQRIAVAGVLAMKPDVLLMDEPTSALDPIATKHIEELLLELQKEVTILIVTHNMGQARRISSKSMFMYLGELVEYGDTEAMFSKPSDERTKAYLTGKMG